MHRLVVLLLLSSFLFPCVPAAIAQTDDPSRAVIAGTVVDAESGEPLPGAAVRIREIGQGQAVGVDGRFRFERLQPRSYTLSVQFLGYAPTEEQVETRAGETTEVTLELEPSSLELPDVVVTGTGRERGLGEAYRPTSVMAGNDLQMNLSSSVPQTLTNIPGFHATYNGPAASQPTIRGMGGDRVLMLEDGHRTGDLYSTASDHGVLIDPISVERMEVVRGPAGLLYGSNALGGVINIIRGEVPRSQPDELTGTLTTQLESVNRGGASGILIEAPVGAFSLRAEASARMAGNTRTPLGEMPSTGMETYNLSAGGSWIADWGFLGASYRGIDMLYGVPGTFDGEVIPGAHPGGVDIDAERHVVRVRGAYQEGYGFIDVIEFDANWTRYLHNEIEDRDTDGQPFFGTQFDQISGEANLTARHDHDLQDVRTEGAIGVSFLSRDLLAEGVRPGTRSAREWTAAAFAYEELAFSPFRVQIGLRYDYREITPRDRSPIEVQGREKPVSARTFGDLSGSISALYEIREDWVLGASVARSFRNPSIEDLYSDGPHLADFSFDIGTPDLDSEVGTGFDAFLRVTRPNVDLELSTYANRVNNFIYYRPTGEVVRVDIDRFVPVFEAQADNSDFYGAEGRLQWELQPQWILDVTASYTQATRRAEGDPLPYIPPLNGHAELRYKTDSFFATLGTDAAAPQNRVPDPIPSPVDEDELIHIQQPTDGYLLLNVGAGMRFMQWQGVHTLSFEVNNLTNRVWYDHLSRIKEIAPQPGRNVQLTYRVHF